MNGCLLFWLQFVVLNWKSLKFWFNKSDSFLLHTNAPQQLTIEFIRELSKPIWSFQLSIIVYFICLIFVVYTCCFCFISRAISIQCNRTSVKRVKQKSKLKVRIHFHWAFAIRNASFFNVFNKNGKRWGENKRQRIYIKYIMVMLSMRR